ncbi:hypothetical protein C0992_010164, partial [Termitomyces sp. T32_za158]
QEQTLASKVPAAVSLGVGPWSAPEAPLLVPSPRTVARPNPDTQPPPQCPIQGWCVDSPRKCL